MAQKIGAAAKPQNRTGLCYAQTAQQQKHLSVKLAASNASNADGVAEDGPSYSDLLVRAFFLFLFICAMIFGVSQAMSAWI